MKYVAFIAATLTTAGLAAPAHAQTPATAAPELDRVAKSVREAVATADAAIKAGDTTGAVARLQAVRPQATNASEMYLVGSTLFSVSRITQDPKQQQEAIDLILASGKLAPAQAGDFYMVRGRLAYVARDYAGAERYLTQAIAANVANTEVYAMLCETRMQLRKPAEALDALLQGIARMKAAGQTPRAEWFERGIAIAHANKLAVPADRIALEWISSAPLASHWRQALAMHRDLNKLERDNEIDLLRLARATKALAGRDDYIGFAKLMCSVSPVEARAALDDGSAAGYFTKATEAAATCPTPALAGEPARAARTKLANAAKASGGTFKQAMAAGDSYLGYGMWNEAIEFYTLALTKPGADADLASLRLGIAQAQGGQKDAAKASLARVAGPGAGIARYWSLWVDTSSQPG